MNKTQKLLILAFLVTTGFLCTLTIPVASAAAVTPASLSISLGSLPALYLSPGRFGSTAQNISITTDNYTGYSVSLMNNGDTTSLINTSDSSLTIPTITLPAGSDSIPATSIESGYGISVDGTNFLPAPDTAGNISIGNKQSAGTGPHTITFAAKPSEDTDLGTYSHTFVIMAVVNDPQYSINYVENAGADTVENMPSDISQVISSTGTAVLASEAPTRSGYVFLGWDTDATATSPTYPVGTSNSIALEPTTGNEITLNAIWEESGGSGTEDNPYQEEATTYDPATITSTDGYHKFENVEGAPLVQVQDGDIVGFAFTDTGSDGVNAVDMDTGVIALDGASGFRVHIVFTVNLADQDSYDKVVSVIQDTGTSSSHNYSGISLFYYFKSSGSSSSRERDLRVQSFYNKSSLEGSTMSSGNSLTKVDTVVTNYYNVTNPTPTYAFDIEYTPSTTTSGSGTVTVKSSINGGTESTQTFTATGISSLPSATVVLGSNGIDNDTSEDMKSTFKVSEFSVEKIK